MRFMSLVTFLFSFSLHAEGVYELNESEFEKQWRAVPTLDAVRAAVTPDGFHIGKSMERITASIQFTITAEGKAENVTVLSVTPDKPGYKQAFKKYYEALTFEPLVDNPQTPATVIDNTYFGGMKDYINK